MKIIVNAISANTGGIVTYTTNLIEYLGNSKLEATVYVPRSFDINECRHPRVKVKPVPVRYFFGAINRFLWEQFIWRGIVKRSGASVLYSSANYGILFPPIKQILLVQGEIYLNPVYRQKVMPLLTIGEKISAYMRRNLMLFSARHSEVAIFPSKVALDSALDYGPDIASNSMVNYLAVNPRFHESKESRSWRKKGILRLLYVSVFYPHKDPLTLAEATKVLNKRGLETKTRITMEPSDFKPWPTCRGELKKLQSNAYSGIISLGRINHLKLNETLMENDIFVFPSMAETFGFPMLEAMRAGIPLIVSDIPIHREICGDAALYFDPLSVEAIEEAIEKIIFDVDLQKTMSEKSLIQSKQFSWDKTAQQTEEVYAKVLGL